MYSNTNIDDILIEMISPKLKEIEERFSKGEGLTNEDINTLLLKSQFNHIHHLDQKLNEVTADVASLKLDFAKTESKFDTLRADVKTDVASLRLDFAKTESKFDTLRADVKTEIAGLKTEIAGLRTEIAGLKTEIQTSINKNMQWSIGLIVFLVTALKVIDMIWGK